MKILLPYMVYILNLDTLPKNHQAQRKLVYPTRRQKVYATFTNSILLTVHIKKSNGYTKNPSLNIINQLIRKFIL